MVLLSLAPLLTGLQFGEVYLAQQKVSLPGKPPFNVTRAVKLLRNAATAANKVRVRSGEERCCIS
jgi:hypothetical protein